MTCFASEAYVLASCSKLKYSRDYIWPWYLIPWRIWERKVILTGTSNRDATLSKSRHVAGVSICQEICSVLFSKLLNVEKIKKQRMTAYSFFMLFPCQVLWKHLWKTSLEQIHSMGAASEVFTTSFVLLKTNKQKNPKNRLRRIYFFQYLINCLWTETCILSFY